MIIFDFVFLSIFFGEVEFEASLGEGIGNINQGLGIPPRHYKFKTMKCNTNSGNFNDIMIARCAENGAG